VDERPHRKIFQHFLHRVYRVINPRFLGSEASGAKTCTKDLIPRVVNHVDSYL